MTEPDAPPEVVPPAEIPTLPDVALSEVLAAFKLPSGYAQRLKSVTVVPPQDGEPGCVHYYVSEPEGWTCSATVMLI